MGKIVSATPPEVLQGKLGWHLTELLLPRLGLLNAVRGWLTIWDSFGTPGDTVCTATVAREIKRRFPRLRINCITPNPELLELDPSIDRLNSPPTTLVLRYWYLDIIGRKDGMTNLLAPTLRKAGIHDYRYEAGFHLSQDELDRGRERVAHLKRPILTFNASSREKVKRWDSQRWSELAATLAMDYDLVQLGNDDEPELPGATRLAGALSMRESAAVLAHAWLHVGGVSFLMHVANGLGVPAVIIYGGRETPANSGYDSNTNLYVKTDCSPCWIHASHGDSCSHGMECMDRVQVEDVLHAISDRMRAVLAGRRSPGRSGHPSTC